MEKLSYCKHRNLQCISYHNAVIHPCIWNASEGRLHGGVHNCNGEIVTNSGYHDYAHMGIDKLDKSIPTKLEDVIYIGCFIQVWGHIFTDCFAKLWYLNSPECKERIQAGTKIVFLTVDNQPLKAYFKELFAIAGYDTNEWQHLTEVALYENVLIPDNSFFIEKEGGQRFFTEEYRSLIDRIRTGFQLSVNTFPKKVYFTRTGIKNSKKDFGERYIEECFRNAGYTIIVPEEHTIVEQLNYITHCEVYASTEGSISHNAIFCRPGTKVLILRKAEYKNGYQPVINELAELNVTYINVGHSIYNDKKEPWQGPFFIYPTKELFDVLNSSSKEESLWFNIEWWRYNFYFHPLAKALKTIYDKTKNCVRRCHI